MTELLKGVCTIILVVCVGLMIYSIYNAIATSKKNKATDEATRKIFMAKLQRENGGMQAASDAAQKTSAYLKQPLTTVEADKPKSLNYDEYEDDVDVDNSDGRNLKDFFKT